ncbi:MAG: J domain-containing protein [Proteobacteria bacterium]|nr:J domain-containing protein [Pseudomonadota bacterium]
MKQESLFDEEPTQPGGRVVPVGIPGGDRQLGKAQKRFNTLIAKIEAQRRLVREWQDFMSVYQQRVVADYEPLRLRLRERQCAMVALLDRTLDGAGKTLTKRERAKVRDILLDLLGSLLSEDADAELVRVHDKHADASYGDERREGMDVVEELAKELFGVELDEGHGAQSPEELARMIGAKLEGAESSTAEPADEDPPARRRSAKQAAKQARLEAARAGASRSLREVYRKLASELHPDREVDLAERARKTALMQRVNQAYEASDLLALLELQLSIEQIDARALGSLAQERLDHYNLVLEEQLERLREELEDVARPFVELTSGRLGRELTPAAAQRALDADIGNLRAVIREVEADLQRFADVRILKLALKDYRIGQSDDAAEWDMLQAMALAVAAQTRGRRRR